MEWRQAGTVIERPLCDDVSLRTRSEAARCRRQVRPRVDDLAAALNTTPLAETRVLEMDAADLARLSECGFYDGSLNSRFAQQMAHAFKGRLQWCSKERNEGERAIEAWARRNGRDPHAETVARFNCTGTDIVEHPSINLKPRNFLHEPPGGYPRWMRQRTNPAWVEPAAAGHAMDAGETTATCAGTPSNSRVWSLFPVVCTAFRAVFQSFEGDLPTTLSAWRTTSRDCLGGVDYAAVRPTSTAILYARGRRSNFV